MRYFLIIVTGDTEPELHGPFADEVTRDNAAIRHKREHGDDDGIFWLDINRRGDPESGAYASWFLAGFPSAAAAAAAT